MKNRLSIIFIFFFLLLFSFSQRVFSASIFVTIPEIVNSTVNPGEIFTLDVVADTDGVSVNSVSLVLDYNENLVFFSGYKADDGMIKFWIDSPKEKDGKIYLSGIIPGGVSGLYDPNKTTVVGIPLVRLLFTAEQAGNASFSFIESSLLRNDGKGSVLPHEQNGLSLIIDNDINKNSDIENIIDQTSPLPFVVDFISSSFFSKTPSMIIFNAVDAESGIKSYKIKIGASIWKNTQSPQVISKGFFSYNVAVRATDFYGNFRDANIRIPGIVSFRLLLVIFILFLSSIFGYKMLK